VHIDQQRQIASSTQGILDAPNNLSATRISNIEHQHAQEVERLQCNKRAQGFGRYSNRRAVVSIRCFVSSAINFDSGAPLRTTDTVAGEQPLAQATSWMVIAVLLTIDGASIGWRFTARHKGR
jgi:hypothetical protein